LSAEIIEMLSFTGTSNDLRGRVEALRDAGYDQFTIQIVEGQEAALEDWAAVLKPLGLGT
jgi:5,10-methylenetetrahydromethanopterin reductase